MAKTPKIPAITGAQAKFILEKLIDDRKVTASDVRIAIASMWEELNFMERRLEELRGAAQPFRHPVHVTKKAANKLVKKARKISQKTRDSYRLQGQYLGYIRQIPEKEKAKFREIAKKDGRAKAVAAMKKRLGK